MKAGSPSQPDQLRPMFANWIPTVLPEDPANRFRTMKERHRSSKLFDTGITSTLSSFRTLGFQAITPPLDGRQVRLLPDGRPHCHVQRGCEANPPGNPQAGNGLYLEGRGYLDREFLRRYERRSWGVNLVVPLLNRGPSGPRCSYFRRFDPCGLSRVTRWEKSIMSRVSVK